MTIGHYIGITAVLFLITIVGIYSGKKVRTVSDFTGGGRRSGSGIVAGTIIGTLVGGASTIGTAQMAYSYGFSAWWFTLGGGIGCLILAYFFAKPLYNREIITLPQIFTQEYGRNAGTISTVMTSMGTFLSIVSQVLSGIALITTVISIPSDLAILLSLVMMMCYVVFGGVWGAGMVGISKTILLSVSVIACGIMAIYLQGGILPFKEALPAGQYFSLIARGLSLDLGAGLSMVLGILSTQVYIQAIVSARNIRLSRMGALISAALIPLIGVCSIFVGMYMKINYPEINPASALPLFIMEQFPPLIAGCVIGTLLITLVGTGAGLSLGLSTMIINDIYKVYLKRDANDRLTLAMSRIIIVLILLGAAMFTTGNMGSLILGWSFMSMGLRGAVAFAPLCTALFLPGRIPQKFALISMILGPLLVLLGKFILPETVDPLFLGVGGAFLSLAIGLKFGKDHSIAGTKSSK